MPVPGEVKTSEKVLLNYSYIRERLDAPQACDYLIEKDVFDVEEGEYINAGVTNNDRSDRFLQKLLKKCFFDEIYKHFIDSLNFCQQMYIVNILENTRRTSTDISDRNAISALNYMLIAPQNDILEGMDIHCLAIGCLENFVITLDEYIDVYNQHVCNRTKAGEMLIRSILKMPRLFRRICEFMKAMQAMEAFPLFKDKVSLFETRLNSVHVDLVRGNYPSLQGQMINYRRTTHNRFSVRKEFHTNVSDLLWRGTVQSRCQMSITMNNEDAWKITNAIQNRHPELVYLFTKVFHAHAVEASVGSIRIAFTAYTADLNQILMSFISERNEPLCQFLEDLLCNSDVSRTDDTFFDMSIECIPLIGPNNIEILSDPAEVINRRGQMLSDVLYLEDFLAIDKLGAYLENTDVLIDLILKLEKSDLFLQHIRETENEKVYNRIAWSGSSEGLARGFRDNQGRIANIPNVNNRLRARDPCIFDLNFDDENVNDDMKRYDRQSKIYDELCNIGEYRVVDAIQKTAKLVANGTRTDVRPEVVLTNRRQMVVSLLIDHTRYLGHGEDYFEFETFLQFVEKKQKLPIFFAHIQDIVDESVYERITWFGTHQQLMKGFIANYDLLVNLHREQREDNILSRLFRQLDPEIVKEEEWTDMAEVDKRYTMIIFLQHIFESGFECIAHLYDTLCNIHANDIVDQIRNAGTTGVSYDETAVVEQTVLTGKFRAYTM